MQFLFSELDLLYFSIGSPGFCCGAASPLKTLLTNCLGLKMVMGKGGKCQYIMALTNLISSLFHHLSRKLLEKG